MNGSLRFFKLIAVFMTALVVVISTASILLSFRNFRNSVYSHYLTKLMPEGSSWKSLNAFSFNNCTLERLLIPVSGSAQIISDATFVKISLKPLSLTAQVEGIMSGQTLYIQDPVHTQVDFFEGKFDIKAGPGGMFIRLIEWSSSDLQFDAELLLDNSGSIKSGTIRGLAKESLIMPVLSKWKSVTKSSSEVNRRRFLISWSATHLNIEVDQKPFFKAGWSFA